MPRNKPIIEEVNEKKFRKNVDSKTLMTMSRGRTIPKRQSKNPIRISVQGLIIFSAPDPAPDRIKSS